MCNYFSLIIDRRFKAWWLETTVSHEKIIEKSGWKDDKLKNRDFVRIEIVPKDFNKVTRNKEDWEYKVDEESSLPAWYIHNEEKAQKAGWAAWEESVKINLAIDKEIITTNERYILAFDSAQVEAFDSAQVEAFGSAQVKAFGSAQVKAFGSAQVLNKSSGKVTLHSDTAVITDYYRNTIIVTTNAKVTRVDKEGAQ